MSQVDPSITRINFPYQDPALRSILVPKERLDVVYEMNQVRPISNLSSDINEAMANPIGSPALSELVRPGQNVALLVDDLSRPTPAHQVLPHIVEELLEAGIERKDIVVVMALGSHRPMKKLEISKKIGKDIADTFRVVNSRFWDSSKLSLVGRSDDGVDILIDEEVARAEVKIGIGSVVPHAAVGWSGGGKIIYPGIAGKETVRHFHFTHGLTEENMTGRETCIVRDRLESWVDIVGLDFIVNCVLTPDDRVYKIVAGHYVQAHRTGVGYGRDVYCRKIEKKSDIVVAVSYSHDIDFWQGTKGIYSAEPLVNDGGTLLLITPCVEGLGIHTDFPRRIGADNNKELMLAIMRGETEMPEDPLPIAPGAMLSRLRKRIRCVVVSPGLTKAQVEQAGYEKMPDAQSALDQLLNRYPQGTVSVVMRSDLTFSGA